MNLIRCPAVVLLLLFGSCQSGAQVDSPEVDTPEKLLRAILDHSMRRDYDGVRQHIYSVRMFGGTTTQDAAVYWMKQARADHTGDWSYSDDALRTVVGSHMQRWMPCNRPSLLRPTTMGGLLDDELMRTTDGDPDCFPLLDHERCHILLVELDGQYKLLFWEGMNHLLTDEQRKQKKQPQ